MKAGLRLCFGFRGRDCLYAALLFVLPNRPTRAKVRAFPLTGVVPVFSILQAAGWPIWPLLFASVIAVALIIERATALRRGKIVPAGLLQSAVADYRQNGIGEAQLVRLEAHSPLGRELMGRRLGDRVRFPSGEEWKIGAVA